MVSGASAQVSNEALEEESGLQRSLTSRHMQMIAIGGAIGTGLFVASGATVSTAGPGGAPGGLRGDRPHGAAAHAVPGGR